MDSGVSDADAQRHRQVGRQLGLVEAELADVLARVVHADASSRRTETRLRDCTSASRRRIGPRKLPLSFCGRHMWPRRSRNTTGASSTIEAGLKPRSNAAAYTKGLKLEPGWRRAWVARLNLLPAKL